jgi:hypothetical protein
MTLSTITSVRRGDVLAAAILPIACWGGALFIGLEPAQWLSPSRDLLRGLSADALLFTAGAVVLTAPLAGVSALAASRRQPPWRLFARLVSILIVFVASSAAITLAVHGGDSGAVAFVVRSHTALAAVTLALAMFGALCGSRFQDELDAALCSLSLAVFAAGGLLVAGASVADMPRGLLNVALVASPLVAITSAAQIDLVRIDVLYQISPLAHLGIDYPVWSVVSVSYLVLAAVCFAGVRTGRAPRMPLPHLESIRTPQMS